MTHKHYAGMRLISPANEHKHDLVLLAWFLLRDLLIGKLEGLFVSTCPLS